MLKKILVYAGIAAVVLATLFTAYVVIVTPSKEPYRAALNEYQAVREANISFSQIGAGLGASSVTDEQFEKNIEAAATALGELLNKTEALGGQEVLKEGEGKTLYDAFYKNVQAYSTHNEQMIDTISRVRPVVFECSQTTSLVTESEGSARAINECVGKLETVIDVSDADYRQFVYDLKDAYTQLAENIAAAAALSDPDGADSSQSNVYAAQRTEIIESLNAAATTLAKNLAVHRAEVDITETAKTLDDYLSKKSSIFW